MERLPAIAVTGAVYFPTMLLPMNVGKPASLAAWRAAQRDEGYLVLLHDDLEVGGLFRIRNSADIAAGAVMGQLEGHRRVRVVSRDMREGMLVVEVAEFPSQPDVDGAATQALFDAVQAYIDANPSLPPEAANLYRSGLPAETLIDLACLNSPADRATKLRMLAEPSVAERARLATPSYLTAAAEHEARGIPPRPPEPAPEDDLGEFPHHLRGRARYLATIAVRTGFYTGEQVLGIVRGQLGEDEVVDKIVGNVLNDARRSQQDLADRTEADRLLDVMAALPDAGIQASCAEWSTQREAHEAMAQAARDFPGTRGWALFTTQDLDRACQGGGVNIAFGGEDREAVARSVVAAITAAGLPVWWPEDVGTKVYVPIRWQRRLPTNQKL